MVKKQDKQSVTVVPQENPEWLLSDPEGAAPPPPVQSRANSLPFEAMDWKNFERLCRRLAECGGKVEQAWAYGKPGQAQFGIDILVRLTDGNFEVWQTKRYRNFKPANVRAAIRLFLKHKWAAQAKKFVLAVACELDAIAVVEAIETGRNQLHEKSIDFEPLGATQLTDRLRTEPIIIDDFFDRPWVTAVCPPEALELLANRISRFTRKALRESLRNCYSSWIATIDPGLPIAGLDRLGRTLPTVPLSKRYVRPDVVLRSSSLERAEQTTEIIATRESVADLSNSDFVTAKGSGRKPGQHSSTAIIREQRMTADRFLASTTRTIIAADAGVGKSTLLRVFALDILSDTPEFDCVRERYADYLPVWVSFPLWARMASGRAAPPPLEDVVAEFFRAQSEPTLAAELCKALAGSGIFLLVDGLDEATDPTAAQTVAALLSAFVETRGFPTIVTTRPHGLRTVGGFAGTWVRAELALLSDAQRHALAKVWFRVLDQLENGSAGGDARLESYAEQRATNFTSALQINPGIARLTQTPLFLLALTELYRHGHQLPRSRFAAIEKIVEQLVEHQPQRRATDSLLTISPKSNPRLRDRLLADFAFGLQSAELAGAVTDAATEDAAVASATEVVIERQGNGNREDAETTARSVFEFAEERAGLLVKKAPRNIGFLHLSIQEFLAGRYLAQRPQAEKVTFVQAHAGESRWREPILYLLYLVSSESEVGNLIRAIEQAMVADRHAANVRNALLTDAVFADFAHDIKVAREIAAKLLAEAELTAWGERQRHLLTSAVDGLSSEAVAQLCQAKIAEWIPNCHGYSRAAVLRTMPRWPVAVQHECFGILMRSLVADEESTRIAAAEVLPAFSNEEHDAKKELKRFLKAAPSPGAVATTLYALGHGWAKDADVGGLAAVARSTCDTAINLEAIRIRAMRGETDDADFERFFMTTYRRLFSGGTKDLIEHFAETRRELFIGRLHETIDKQHDRNPHALRPLIGSLIICDPDDALIAAEMLDLLTDDWNIREIFTEEGFPADKVRWTPELIDQIERFASKQDSRFHDYELYWIAKVVRSDVIKSHFIRNMTDASSFRIWAARALTEVWGGDDREVRAALLPFLHAKPDEVALVAEALPAVVGDKDACRAVLVHALRGRPRRVGFLFSALRRLGVSSDDQEAFDVAREAWDGLKAPLYQDEWRTNMILTFPRRPEVRVLAVEEMMRRDGAVGAIAESYADDAEITSRLLRMMGSQSEGSRALLVSALQLAAAGNNDALAVLEATREDKERAISFEGTIGWVEALLARGAFESQHIEALVTDLAAVGPDYEARRAAAVAGLAIAGHLDRFAAATDQQGKPLRVSTAIGFLREDDRYLRRFLARWDELICALGDEAQVFERLEITPDNALLLIDPSHPNAQRVFDLLMQSTPSSPHLPKHVPISAMAHFAPKAEQMRELIIPALTTSKSEYWEMLIAGEIFAEHFGEDVELRHQVVEHFVRDPKGTCAAALAELVLRRPDSELEKLLREKTVGAKYDIATHFKLVAALSAPKYVIEALEKMLTIDLSEIHEWQFPRWVPAIVRRIENDSAVQDLLHAALTPRASASVKASFVSLLSRGARVDERLRAFIVSELDRTESEEMPEVGFDLSSQSYRLVRQVLIETIG
jgi:hypothetical protein